MVEVINNSPGPARDESSSGWAVAVVILIIVVAGGLAWFFWRGGAAPQAPNPQNIQIEVPTPQIPTPGGTESGGAQ
jgi:hypothetical protein